jgi:hypothetical protein
MRVDRRMVVGAVVVVLRPLSLLHQRLLLMLLHADNVDVICQIIRMLAWGLLGDKNLIFVESATLGMVLGGLMLML